MEENEISKVILDAAIAVHNELGGPGLLVLWLETPSPGVDFLDLNLTSPAY